MAVFQLASHYNRRQAIDLGLPQNHVKAMEMWMRAGKLGHKLAYHNIGRAYQTGSHGMEPDEKKAIHYYQLSAMRGDVAARYNLGMYAAIAGDFRRAVRHYAISAAAGCTDSLAEIKMHFSMGNATKDEYASALRANKEAKDEMKSPQRDAAAREWV